MFKKIYKTEIEKKKIGIITIHNCKSFGACLQTYALYQYFLNIGYDCEVIDLRRKEQPNFVKSRKYRPYYLSLIHI